MEGEASLPAPGNFLLKGVRGSVSSSYVASDHTPTDPDDGATRRVERSDPSPEPVDEAATRRSAPDDNPTVRGLAPGRRVFGRYVLEAIAGRGGMGVVWKARDEELGEAVALKFLPETVALDAAAVDELRQETRRARRLTHANIVRIHDFARNDAMAAVSMEFVEGQTLTNLRVEQRGKVFAPADLAPLVAQLCVALEYAHKEAKVVHRDLKPANLLVTRDGRLKVTDFGIARSLSESHTRITGHVGATSGTLPYMSPQQLAGDRPTAADDIYALGATLYELLTGKPPFFRGDAYSLMTQIKNRRPDPLADRRAELAAENEITDALPSVPDAWEETILACLAKDPAQRPQSAAEVARRLGLGSSFAVPAAVAGGGSAPEPESSPAVIADPVGQSVDEAATRRAAVAPSASRRDAAVQPARSSEASKRKNWRLPIALLAVVVLAVAGFLFWPRSSGTAPGNREQASTQRNGQKERSDRSAQVQPLPQAALPREFTVTVDPPDAGARLWLGPVSDGPIQDGRAVVKDLPDGEQDLVVQAPGYQPLTTRVTVREGRGTFEAKLVPVRGAVAITARPGTQVTAVDASGHATHLGTIPAGGTLSADNLLTVGTYSFRLEHPDCAPAEAKDVELVIGRTAKIAPAQTPLPGELRIFSVPTGAEVRINGTAAGKTPATIKNQPSEQALRVEVYQRGYRRMEQDVTLKPKEVRTVNIGTLVAESGGIELRLSDKDLGWASVGVLVDGKAIQVEQTAPGSPLHLGNLEVGSRTVEITHPDYEPWRQAVTVRDQETTPVEVKPAPKPGRLTVRADPSAIVLVVNGRSVRPEEIRSGEIQLPAGEPLELQASARGYKSATRSLTLAPNGAQTWDVALEKLRGAEEGQAWTVPDLNLEMVYIRPGTFTMGSPVTEQGRNDDEIQHTVILTEGFWLGKTVVTQAQWEAVMGGNPSKFKNAGRDAPVEQVSWDDAMQFCRKLTERERQAGHLPEGHEYTLPTEAQWEYACRAGTTGPFAGNGDLDSMGWYNQNSGNTTHPVAQKQPNAWGLYDMHGNVWEWCRDWYGHYPGGSVTDPTGPSSGSDRVLRGGSWYSGAAYCRSADRYWFSPGDRYIILGFRLALAPQVSR